MVQFKLHHYRESKFVDALPCCIHVVGLGLMVALFSPTAQINALGISLNLYF